MVSDLRHALASKHILAILFLSAFIRLIFYSIILPKSPSSFGPDEGNYAALAKYVSEGLPVEEFPNFGPGLYNSAKSVILPSAGLIKLGIEELSAIRLISTLYGIASSLMLAMCFFSYQKIRHKNSQECNSSADFRFVSLLALFSFLPSNFIWSTIGLRESGSQFWLIASFYMLLKLFNAVGGDKLRFALLAVVVLTFAYGTRPQTALIFSVVALALSAALLVKLKKIALFVVIAAGTILGQAFTTTPVVASKETLGAFRVVAPSLTQNSTAKPSDAPQNSTAKPTEVSVSSEKVNLSDKCQRPNQTILFDGQLFQCKSKKTYEVVKRNPVVTIQQQILTTQILEYKRAVNALDAQSALPLVKCQNFSQDVVTLIKCNAAELPYRFFAFLFRPLLFFDKGSTFLELAAIENLGWLTLISLFFFVLLRPKKNLIERVLSSSLALYVFLFASGAALYEGNLGTAFRHKSSILWPIIFTLMIASQAFPQRSQRTNP